MALEADETIFPANVVKWVSLAMKNVDPGNESIKIFKRPLKNSDPAKSIGVYAQQWTPDEDTYEIMGIERPGGQMPTLQHYMVGVQGFVKDTTEERGLATHANMSQRIRSVLYTDPDLQVMLRGLKANLGPGWTESMRRWGVRGARYFSGEIDANMLYLSTMEFWVETETHRTNP